MKKMSIWRGLLMRDRKGGERGRAFTLIEIMIVVAILGIVMAMAVPSIVRALRKEGLRKAVSEILEVCGSARAQAIISGAMVEVRIHPQDGRMEVAAGVSTAPSETGDRYSISENVAVSAPQISGTSATLSDKIVIEMLDVNFIEYRDEELARVRFYPNGTCDEMTIVLRSDMNEWRKISTEVTTGLANVETIR